MAKINQRLNGLNPLSYLGDNSYQPPEFVTSNRPPTANDSQNFELGTLWLDRTTNTPPTAEDVYILVSLSGSVATWVNFAGGTTSTETLTGNSGGAVGVDGSDNINVLGDTTTINIVGNPGTNTLTVSTVGTGVVSSLTGDSGGAVFPTANNTNIVGSGVITVVGNPGTSTLTITPSGAIASSFITNPATGTATPSSGVLTFAGTGDVTVSAAGSTITINGSGSGTVSTLHTDDGNNVTPTAGVINIVGGNSLATTGTVGPNTVTISLDGITQYNVQTGGAANALNNVAPSATSGVPLISQGAASQPVFGTAVVAGGGTGATSFTAYAPITGGTTTTNPLQSADTGIATAGFVLTSTGAASLPTWQAAPGANGGMVYTIGPAFLNDAISAQYSVFNYSGQTTVGPQTSGTLIPYAGTISTMYILVESNANTATGNFWIMKNGVDTTLTIAIGAGATGLFSDLVHSFAVVAGDVICLHADHATTGATAGSCVVVLS